MMNIDMNKKTSRFYEWIQSWAMLVDGVIGIVTFNATSFSLTAKLIAYKYSD